MKHIEITNFAALPYSYAEEVNTLCTNLSFYGNSMKCIMVTSCVGAEGKSFMSMNIMRTLATLGKRVALVNADLRRSMIESRYGLEFQDDEHLGITHYLAGLCKMNEVIYQTSIPNAFMVPIGRTVSNSLPLLNTPRFSKLLNHLKDEVDFVIVDAPPIGIIIDAAEIAKSCDGTLLVVQHNKVARKQLLETKQQIERTGCQILGAVLNNVSMDSYSSRKYYYKSYYSYYGKYGRYGKYYTRIDNSKKKEESKHGKRLLPKPSDKTEEQVIE